MRTLRELEAVFVGRYQPGGSFHEQGDVMAGAQGVLFVCPVPACSHSIIVWFADRGVPAEAHPAYRWAVSGSSLDDLTLSPSINLDIPFTDAKGVTHPASCRWHGFIQNGKATP
jgi:hypothetical protein